MKKDASVRHISLWMREEGGGRVGEGYRRKITQDLTGDTNARAFPMGMGESIEER